MEKERRLTLKDSQKRATIEIHGSVAKIEGVSVFDVNKILTFTMPNYWFSPKYRKHVWDGKIRFLKGRWFPVGFINRVRRSLSVDTVVVRDSFECNYDPDSLSRYIENAKMNTKERDYMEAAVRVAIKERLGIVNLAANAGKSRCIGAILSAFPKNNFLVLAHRIDALHEVDEALREFLPDAENYTLSTFQSAKKLDLDVFDGVLVDECHVTAAKTFYKLVSKCKNAVIRLGFTASKRADGLGFYVEAVLGEVIYTIEQVELMRRGISVRPKVYLVPFKVPFADNGDYMSAEDLLTNCEERNQLIADLVKDRHEVLILFKRKKHGRLLEDLIPDSVRIDGDTTKPERDRVKKEFKNKQIKRLLASSIFDAGVNLNNILTLVLAWGGKSPIALTQRIGRALRSAEGKYSVDVFVIYDIGNKYFKEHSKARTEQFIEMGLDVEIWKIPEHISNEQTCKYIEEKKKNE